MAIKQTELVADEGDWDGLSVSLFPLEGRRTSLVGTIAETIGLAIVKGELLPGNDLNSVDLSERFNTSRTPVREALMLLEKEGLIVIPPRRRPQVAMISAAEILEIYRIRELLLVDAIDQVVTRASDEELATLVEISDAMASELENGSITRSFINLARLHDQIISLSKNQTLKKIMDRLRLQTTRVRYAVYSLPGQAERTQSAHSQLVQALVNRNAPLAKGFIQSILRQAQTLVEQGDVSFTQATSVVRRRRRRSNESTANGTISSDA